MKNLFFIFPVLFGLFLVALSGIAISDGHITVGRYHHTTVYAATSPHEFWFAVILYAALGVYLLALPFFRR
jgi:hypothetical protein